MYTRQKIYLWFVKKVHLSEQMQRHKSPDKVTLLHLFMKE